MISSKIREELEKLVIPEMPYTDIVDTVEEHMKQEKVIPGFPVNISVNEIAAHDTAAYEDKRLIKDDDLVKIDFGFHNGDGLVIDNALTIDLSGSHGKLINGAKRAVEKAVKELKTGIRVSELSEIIYDAVVKEGVIPISNLTGHNIEPYWIHGGIPIPTVPNDIDYEFKDGDILAIEVFTTYEEGSGKVEDTGEPHIFSLVSLERGIRTNMGRKLLTHIVKEYKTLPFSDRWLIQQFKSKFMVKTGLQELIKNRLIERYPPLKEEKGQPVAQYEVTVKLVEGKPVELG